MADTASDEGALTGGDQQWQSLYRRYRPQRFDEIRGQHHVTLALRNAVRDGRVGHAYLFSGPRGTGKTSTARILAKALNCTDLADGEPCGKCESCVAITRGASFDVHELDAASNNGVEAMRDLVARSALATPGRWKVYIVDEVHMLSTAASNALLKTLEEPPAHVVFVLATTDPQKVLPTIRSRTQHFEFHLLSNETLVGLLEDIASAASLELPPDGVQVAVRRGRGSARDALSVLDQVAAAGEVEDEAPVVAEIIAAIAGRDTARALVAVGKGLELGRDAYRLAVDLTEQLRRAFLSLAAPTLAAELEASSGPQEASADDIRELGLARCVRAMEIIGATQVDMRTSADPRVTLEIALARITHPEADDSTAALLDRIQRLEETVRSGGGGRATSAAAPAASVAPAQAPATASTPEESSTASEPLARTARPEQPLSTREQPTIGAFMREAAQPPSEPVAQPKREAQTAPVAEAKPDSPHDRLPPSRDELVQAWGDAILTGLRPKARTLYQAGRFVSVDGNLASFTLPNDFHRKHADAHRLEVETAISGYFRTPVRLELMVDADGGDQASFSSDRGTPAGPATGAAGDDDSLPDPDDYEAEAASTPKDAGLSWATDRLMQAFPGAEEV